MIGGNCSSGMFFGGCFSQSWENREVISSIWDLWIMDDEGQYILKTILSY